MKRMGSILCLSLLTVLIAINFSFASGLTLVKSFPEEGNSGLTPANIAIKLVFSEKVADPVSISANSGRFAIVDAEGKPISFEPLYNEAKYPNEVWLQIEETLTQNSSYKVTISEGMQSSTGNTLDKSINLNFSTRNTEADSKGYMMLMMVMIGGMVAFSIFDTKRKIKKETAKKEEDLKVNPYKEARRTGKSVEQVVARTDKEKAQAEKRRARVAKRQNDQTDEEDNSRPSTPGVKRVKKARTISEKGYATPRNFIEQRIAREEAKAQAKNKRTQPSRSKGSKQQQRKKK